MTNIQIAVAYHKNSPIIKNECLLPIQVGKACSDIELNMQGDDTGDNISAKNFGYAELTAIYWLWKNSKADIKGLCHYRRYLDLNPDSEHKGEEIYEYPLDDAFSAEKFLSQLQINKQEICNLLKDNVIITRKKEDLRTWSKYTVKSHYAAEHHGEHLEKALEIIKNDHPEYYQTAISLVNGTTSYYTNVFIMDSKHYDEYCSWMFDILFKIEPTLNLYDKTLAPNTKKARWAGFLGERLTAIYIQKQIDSGKKVAELPAVILTEPNKKWFDCNTYDNKLYTREENKNKIVITNKENPSFPIISVCIAAYNVEKYIEKCLSSVLTQTLQNIEIIVVNDGSKDRTLDIINEFSKKDKRIKVINQENQGLGTVRNVGLKESTGKYVHFLDGDDWIDNTFLEKFVKNAEKYNSDLVISNHICFEDGTDKELYRSTLPHTLYGYGKNIDNLPDLLMEPCHVWDKIYKKELIVNIVFPDRSSGEDIPFWYQALLSAKSVSIVREPLYHYRMNPNSVQTKSQNVLNCFNNIKFAEKFIAEQSDLVKQYFEIFKQTLIGHMMYRARVELARDKNFRKMFYQYTKSFLNRDNIILSPDLELKKAWYWCDFQLMDKIKSCHSFSKFEKLIGVRSSQKLIFDVIWNYIKKIVKKKKTVKYQKNIDEALSKIVYPVKFRIFGLSLLKIKKKGNKVKIYILGIPLFKRDILDIYEKFYFCGCPVISRNKIKTRLLGITIRNDIDAYLIKTFDYLGWKINDVYQGCFDDIGYNLHEVLPEKIDKIANDIQGMKHGH